MTITEPPVEPAGAEAVALLNVEIALLEAHAITPDVVVALATPGNKVGPLLESRAAPVVHLPTDPPPPPTCVYLGHRPRMVWIRGTDGETVPVCVRCGAAL